MSARASLLHRAVSPAYPLARRVLRRFGIEVSRSVKKDDLQAFFAKFRPLETEHELIRVGGFGDGGYLIPNDLEGVAACFSPGVASVADFELDLAKRGIRSYLADFSVDGPPVSSDLFDFEKKFLGGHCDDVFMTLDRWLDAKQVEGNDLILQMDIEGSEYDVIFQTDRATLRRFRILAIEFHGFEKLGNPPMLTLMNNAFDKILVDFEIVHIHPNNFKGTVDIHGFDIPFAVEVTLLRKDRIKTARAARTFPHELDRKCVADRPDVPLPRFWYER